MVGVPAGVWDGSPTRGLFPTPRFPEEWALDMCRFSECPNPSLGC